MSLLYIFKRIKVELDFFKFNFCFHLLRLQTTTILFYAWLGSVYSLYSIQYTVYTSTELQQFNFL